MSNQLIHPDYCKGFSVGYQAAVALFDSSYDELARAGDVLAHAVPYPAFEPELARWWNMRGTCSICEPEGIPEVNVEANETDSSATSTREREGFDASPYLTPKETWHIPDWTPIPVHDYGLEEPKQAFWRCEHHPSAIDNMHAELTRCEYCCHTTELRWWDNGTCKPPT